MICACTYPRCKCGCEPCRYGYHALYLPCSRRVVKLLAWLFS
jgi:hypothetical protein